MERSFSDILNSVDNTDCKEYALGQFQKEKSVFNCFSVPEVLESIHELASCRSNGNDGLSAEHFKHTISISSALCICVYFMEVCK